MPALLDFNPNPIEGEYHPAGADANTATHRYTQGGWHIVKHDFALSSATALVTVTDLGNNRYEIDASAAGGGDVFKASNQTFTGINTFSNDASSYAFDNTGTSLAATTHEGALAELDARLDDMGTFSGTTITDNVAVETALQELETAVESATSSDWVLISTSSPAGGVDHDITLDTATYKSFRIEAEGVGHNQGGNEQLTILAGHTGGTVFLAGTSYCHNVYESALTGSATNNTQQRANLKFPQGGITMVNTMKTTFTLDLVGFASVANPIQYVLNASGYDSTTGDLFQGSYRGLIKDSTNAIDTIRFTTDGGGSKVAAGGTIRLYGRK